MTREPGTPANNDAGGGFPRVGAPATDVLVVGAGPTGLLLAGDLAVAGLSVTLLERRPRTISNLSRAFAVHARTLEQLDTRPSPTGAGSLADELVPTGHRITGLRLFRSLAVDLGLLPTRFPYVLVTPQYEVEAVLQRRAAAAGVRFRYETEVAGLEQDTDGVTVHTREPEGRSARYRAAYAVGTDGHRSTVRQALGIPFPGRSVITSMALADVRLDRDPGNPLTLNAGGDCFALLVPFGDGWHRVVCWDRRDPAPVTAPLDLDEIRSVTRRALGTDLGITECRWLSRFHSDERQAPAYRAGRVLIAGDAAHVHSPAGGQGMNTGLQDAANLGWKLAAVLRDGAPDALLDTYERERHPVGRMVLRTSGALVRLAMAHGPVRRGLRDLATGLVSRILPAAARGTGLVSGIGIRYGAERGEHRLTGRRAPDLLLEKPGGEGPDRLHEALRQGRFVLATPSSGPAHDPVAGTAPAPAGHDAGGGPVHVVTAPGQGRTTLLVRPDGYIAWATDEQDPGRWAGVLREACEQRPVAAAAFAGDPVNCASTPGTPAPPPRSPAPAEPTATDDGPPAR
ncbi:FAD-dependent monooxygenase [Streptomyces meridianus]|uniref:FAD-dependent monooxygenase n=1 Tax=Streptomyces meridianus TaxID=2938945 RepID=A0ABT0X701_9ACTN|nr:FAD-dependent monooxygenase [Streptomyces meridianus]MCM2578302.1 FAD-dependent monooxygenase [Streptomyces meridianus]